MKKVTALLLALAMVFTAVGTASAQASKVKLNVLVSYDVKVLGSHYVELWKQVADELGYEIEFENPGTEAYKTKVKVALAAGELPDVFSVWGGSYLDPFVNAKAVLPVGDAMKKAGLFLQKAYSQPSPDGQTYVIPSRDESYAVTYANVDLLKKIGKPAPKTWNDLLQIVEATKAYNAKNGTKYSAIGLGMKDRWVGEVLYTVIVNSLDKDAFDKLMRGEIKMTDKVFLEAAKRVKTLVGMGAFPNGFIQMASAEANEMFLTGQYVLYPHQSSLLNKFVEGMNPEGFQVIAFPDCATPANPSYAENLMNGNNKIMAGLVINRKTKYPEEATKLALKFAEEANKINVMQFGSAGFLVNKALKPTKTFPTPIKQYADLVTNVDHLTSYWFAAVDAKVGEPWRDLTQKLYAGAVTPENFVVEADKIFAKR